VDEVKEGFSLLGVYGILKRGEALDLTLPKYHCTFLGEIVIPGARLYRIGCGVGLKLDVGPSGVDDAKGELFQIPNTLWEWLDSIENNGRTYTRKVVECRTAHRCPDPNCNELLPIDAWVYEHQATGFSKDQLIEGGVF
jgi:gamma-glutamylcyclotransferase (GGCT)/AIG2-like uncharacterized protein YtfP